MAHGLFAILLRQAMLVSTDISHFQKLLHYFPSQIQEGGLQDKQFHALQILREDWIQRAIRECTDSCGAISAALAGFSARWRDYVQRHSHTPACLRHRI